MKFGKQRKAFSISAKLKIVEEAKKSSNRLTGRVYGLDESVIRQWRKNEEKLIEHSLHKDASRSRLDGAGRKRDDLLDQILYEWYSHQISCNVKISGPMLRAKAEELSSACATSSEGNKFSPGWLEGFKKRYGIRIGNKQTTKEHRDANNELMERILYDWLVHQQAQNVNVTGPMIMAKVIYVRLAVMVGIG